MRKRILTALLLIPPVLYLIGWSPEWLFVLAVVAAVILALREYFALCRTMGFRVFSWVGYAGAVALCIAQAVPQDSKVPLLMSLVLVALLFIPTLALRRSTDLKDYLATTSITLFGILYIGLSLSCLVPLRFSAQSLHAFEADWVFGRGRVAPLLAGPQPVLLLFLVIWADDICAFLVGRSVGRIPFFPRISPRKTWEGALAGLGGSLLAAWAFAHWLWKTADVKTVILLAAWVAVAGQTGDLVESAIKRGANLKDSGTLLPGHGGFLDRIDSLLFAAPALWLALHMLGYFS